MTKHRRWKEEKEKSEKKSVTSATKRKKRVMCVAANVDSGNIFDVMEWLWRRRRWENGLLGAMIVNETKKIKTNEK